MGGDRLDAEERVIGGVGHFIYAYGGDPAAGFPRIVVAYRWALGSYTLRWLLVSSPE